MANKKRYNRKIFKNKTLLFQKFFNCKCLTKFLKCYILLFAICLKIIESITKKASQKQFITNNLF